MNTLQRIICLVRSRRVFEFNLKEKICFDSFLFCLNFKLASSKNIWFKSKLGYVTSINCEVRINKTSVQAKNVPGKFTFTIQRGVVYFDQRLGAAHPKRWLKYEFLMFLTAKSKKIRKN